MQGSNQPQLQQCRQKRTGSSGTANVLFDTKRLEAAGGQPLFGAFMQPFEMQRQNSNSQQEPATVVDDPIEYPDAFMLFNNIGNDAPYGA